MSDFVLSSLVQVSRATACGLGLHAGSSIASSILSGKIFSKNFQEWNPATLGCLKFGAFLGGFAGAYRIIHQLLQQHRTPGSSNVLVAAAIASLASSIQPSGRRHLITLFLAGRALSALIRHMQKRTGVQLPKSLFAAIFTVNVGFLLQAALLQPDSLPASYYKSLLRWSYRYTDEHFRTLFRPCPDQAERLTCQEIVHPGRTCLEDNIRSFLGAWSQSVKIYAVLCTVPLVLFRHKALLKRPVPTIVNTIRMIARSGLFLGTCCLNAYLTVCYASKSEYMRRYNTPQGSLPPFMAFLIGCAGGIPILIEPSSRWYELTMYTTPIVIHTQLKHLQRLELLPKTKNFSVFFFATSMMVIMRAYERQRDTIPPWMVSFLNILLR